MLRKVTSLLLLTILHLIGNLRINSSNHRIAQFKIYCNAKGMQPRKFALIDVRWNSTYLMLKHLLPYRSMFFVFINTHSGYPLLNEQH